MNTLIIKGELPSLNDMISQSKKGKFNYQPYAETKKVFTDMAHIVTGKQIGRAHV